VTGLSPDTAYYYGVEMTGPGGTVTTSAYGPFTTWPTPGTAESFSFAFGSCHSYAETTSSAAFTRISARNPRLFFHLGDFHYADNTSTSQASHLNDLATQINQLSGLKTLMANVPTVYSKSDHDTGDNGSFPGTQTAPNRAAHLQTFPSYTRPDSNGLYHSFVLGRIRFIVLDTRYFAAPDGSTRLGATQLAWLKDQLVEDEPVKIVVQESTWIDDRPAVLGDDTWQWFNAERTEIGNYIQSTAVGQVVMLMGDQHALSADNGSNNPWGGFPMFAAAPFGQWASVKTSDPVNDWSAGLWAPESPAVQQYGHVTVTDDGSTIALVYRGYDSTNTQRVTLTVNVDTTAPPEGGAPKVMVGGVETAATWSVMAGGVEVPVVSWSVMAGGVEVPLV
jgi:alkaline phosphatase D